eukprot:g72264.t1
MSSENVQRFQVPLEVLDTLPESRLQTPASNILSCKEGEDWRCSGSAAVVLKLMKECELVNLVVRNKATGFIRILIGNSAEHQKQSLDYFSWRVLVPWTQLMKPRSPAPKKPQTFRNFSKYVYRNSAPYDCIVMECARFPDGPPEVGLCWVRAFGKAIKDSSAPSSVLSPPTFRPEFHAESTESNSKGGQVLPTISATVSESKSEQASPAPGPPAGSEESQDTQASGSPSAPSCTEHPLPCVRRTHRKPGPLKGKSFWACAHPGCTFVTEASLP